MVMRQLSQIVAIPRSLSEDKQKDDDSKRKGVTFSRVHVTLQGLQRHKEGCPYFVSLNDKCRRVRNAFRKSKITYFPLSLFEENVGRLQIAVDDVQTSQVLASLCNLVCYGSPFDCFIVFAISFEVTSFAVLSDEVAVVGSVYHIFKAYDVWMMELLVYIYLVVEEVYASHAHVLELDDFYSVAGALLVIPDAAVNFAAEAATDEVLQVEAIPAYPFLPLQRWSRLWVVQVWLFWVAGLHIEGAVGAAHLVSL